jgi:CRP-like cAMP-binding protein
MSQSPNRILASLSAEVFAVIQPHLKLVPLTLGEVVADTGSTVTRIYFPHSGVISLVVEMESGHMVETAMVGRDGVFNAAAALDGKVSLNKALVQLTGAASVIDVDRMRLIADEHGSFRSILLRHEQVMFAQSQQSAACNATHLVVARMCKWLLRMEDLAESDNLTVTQEFLAQMIGVRRTSVSLVAGTLQKAGLIKYRRGNVRILDRAGLQEASCECYGTIKAHYERMLATQKTLQNMPSMSGTML